MSDEYLIGVAAFLLSINAFFLKELVTGLKKIELEMVKFSTKHDNVEVDVMFLMKENRIIRDELHQIKGYAKSTLGMGLNDG